MNKEKIITELTFKAIRSSGAGGQHVNKVSSKVVLNFDLIASESLSQNEKELLQKSLRTKLSKENILILSCEDNRSQHRNKEIVTERFLEIIKQGLIIQKTRKATRIPKSVIKKRLESKKRHSLLKEKRRKPPIE